MPVDDVLREAKGKFPHAIGVMITGYPDIEDAEMLINKVKINMLFFKPLTDDKIEELKG